MWITTAGKTNHLCFSSRPGQDDILWGGLLVQPPIAPRKLLARNSRNQIAFSWFQSAKRTRWRLLKKKPWAQDPRSSRTILLLIVPFDQHISPLWDLVSKGIREVQELLEKVYSLLKRFWVMELGHPFPLFCFFGGRKVLYQSTLPQQVLQDWVEFCKPGAPAPKKGLRAQEDLWGLFCLMMECTNESGHIHSLFGRKKIVEMITCVWLRIMIGSV